MNPELKKNLSSGDHWIRALYVILFLICAKIAGFLIALAALVQIIFSLVTGQFNRQLLRFADSLAQYLLAVFVFIIGKTEEKPFPFADWPVSDISIDVEPIQPLETPQNEDSDESRQSDLADVAQSADELPVADESKVSDDVNSSDKPKV